jgi:5-methylcytosine-specific restriction endonuclease McrA
MTRTARVCSGPGCPEVVVGGTPCPIHATKAWAGSTRNQHNPIGWAKIRARVLRRDNNTCVYCGGQATEVDHIIPVSRGGTHVLSNLCASCKGCNASRNHEQRMQR